MDTLLFFQYYILAGTISSYFLLAWYWFIIFNWAVMYYFFIFFYFFFSLAWYWFIIFHWTENSVSWSSVHVESQLAPCVLATVISWIFLIKFIHVGGSGCSFNNNKSLLLLFLCVRVQMLLCLHVITTTELSTY